MSKFFSKRVVKFKTPNLSEKPQDVRGNLLYIIIFVILPRFIFESTTDTIILPSKITGKKWGKCINYIRNKW